MRTVNDVGIFQKGQLLTSPPPHPPLAVFCEDNNSTVSFIGVVASSFVFSDKIFIPSALIKRIHTPKTCELSANWL